MTTTAAPPIPRLLAAPGPELSRHRETFGPLPELSSDQLISALDRSGLSGRGGAGFPTGRKVAALGGQKPVVIGNGAEGEPLSAKDATLLKRAPHLVLDGLNVVAKAVQADKVYLYVAATAVPTVARAVADRTAAGLTDVDVVMIEAPDTFVAGEESAAVRLIEGGPALPRDRITVLARSGVRGRPTLLNNVETLAHVALIARFGAERFRSVGADDDPGTMLVTLSGGRREDRRVLEVPTGTSLTSLLCVDRVIDLKSTRALLLGGYHGSWLSAGTLTGITLDRKSLQPLGANPGAGVIHVLGMNECGLRRMAEITSYLAGQGARQCGPCRNGLPRLAELVDEIAYKRASDTLVNELRRTVRMVDGRGACRHPDGTVRLIRSALRVFAADIEHHRRRTCEARTHHRETAPRHGEEAR
jgi:NADH:ubiquinone oxidoreductase subunit F (NADH-binding)